MMAWTLVLLISVGAFGRGGATVGVVPGFLDQDECRRAGETMKVALSGVVQDVRYVCVVQTRTNGEK